MFQCNYLQIYLHYLYNVNILWKNNKNMQPKISSAASNSSEETK